MYPINKGDKVIVISGRKIPIGTKGTCFWTGTKAWGPSIGILLDNGNKEFTALKNVQLSTAASKVLPLFKVGDIARVINKPKASNAIGYEGKIVTISEVREYPANSFYYMIKERVGGGITEQDLIVIEDVKEVFEPAVENKAASDWGF